MKYILALSLALFVTISLAENIEQVKAQSVLEYCHSNPNHERCKLIEQIFNEVKPRSKISRIWRFVSGKAMFLPQDFMRHYFLISCQDIGKELNWDDQKIYGEFDKLCEEANRIRNS